MNPLLGSKERCSTSFGFRPTSRRLYKHLKLDFGRIRPMIVKLNSVGNSVFNAAVPQVPKVLPGPKTTLHFHNAQQGPSSYLTAKLNQDLYAGVSLPTSPEGLGSIGLLRIHRQVSTQNSMLFLFKMSWY